ncbi:hypothetical protein [Kribbella deserti]|uniref:Protease n=1 Tax=Kribbella deserti TaxID=1926257 RepID=A0ABV6QKY9_9ACTN
MTKFLLSLHVVVAILAIGPVTVAASMFPAATRQVLAARAAGKTGDGEVASLRTLYRICQVYAGLGIAVPVFGFATAGSMGVFGDIWVQASIVLTAAAAGVLVVLVLPGQQSILASFTTSPADSPQATATAPETTAASPQMTPATSQTSAASPHATDASPQATEASPQAAADPADPKVGASQVAAYAPVTPGRLAMYTGIFNLLWVIVTVLMIVRPGSTTGA